MESHLPEEALWASGVAARLRVLQANFADDEATVRQNYLAEELDRSLRSVPPSRRKDHLRALSEQFPGWGDPATVSLPAALGAPRPMPPEEIVEKLMELWGGLDESTRAGLSDRLRQAGLVPNATAVDTGEASPEFWKSFGVSEPKPLDLERSRKMLLALSSLYLALDQLVWALWRQLNNRAVFRKEADFAKLAGPYLTGDPEVSSEQIRQALERTRKLIAALLGALGRGGANFARQHGADVSPEAIEGAARMEKKAFESLEAASWRKYKQLYGEYATEQVLESQIQQEFVKAADELLKGIGR